MQQDRSLCSQTKMTFWNLLFFTCCVYVSPYNNYIIICDCGKEKLFGKEYNTKRSDDEDEKKTSIPIVSFNRNIKVKKKIQSILSIILVFIVF